MDETPYSFLIGVDGGGSRCRFALADAAGRVLARHEAGAANIASDFDAAAVVLLNGLAVMRGHLPPGAHVQVHMGLAGANAAGTAARLAGLMAQDGDRDRLVIEDDRGTAVTAALGGAEGAVASCGTGSFVCRLAGGELRALGGWGLILGDDASGAWLGQQAMRRTILALDGLADETGLTRALAAHAGGTRPEIVDFSLKARPADFAALAPRVIAAAEAGDPQGRALMQAGAEYIRRALAVLGHGTGEPFCLLGGVGRHYAAYLPPGLAPVPPQLPAVSGALLLAARAAGIPTEGKPWI